MRGEVLNGLGMLMDFRQIKTMVQEVVAELDHHDLNILPAFQEQNPTSEALSFYIYHSLARKLSGSAVRVHRVSVHETPETTATFQESE